MVVTLSNFQIDLGRPGFIVSGAQAPGLVVRIVLPAHEMGDSAEGSAAAARLRGLTRFF